MEISDGKCDIYFYIGTGCAYRPTQRLNIYILDTLLAHLGINAALKWSCKTVQEIGRGTRDSNNSSFSASLVLYLLSL